MSLILEVENPIVLGTIEPVNNVATFYVEMERDFRDVYGSLIVFNDDYMEFSNGDIVHLDNIHTYLEDHYNAAFCTKK
ncbi:YqaI family protein [Lysinibacillus xylanilyticus]|uniref:YqaI family protein n=1 Tax=Lysinibacillus xylanilyticus TaxID=582475 RepID=UPI00382BF4AF